MLYNESIMKISTIILLFLVAVILQSCREGFYRVIIDDNFSKRNNYREINRDLGDKPDIEFSQDLLKINARSGEGLAGVYHLTPVAGNFFAEAEFLEDDAAGIVLMASKEGRPDPDNYTLITVNTRGGIVCINQYDRQNGIANIHDPGRKTDPLRYQAVLDSSLFSLPFTSTNKKIRILHESLSNTFHFYYGTRLEKWGIVSDDWMELAPQYSWLPEDQSFFVGLICHAESADVPETTGYRYLRVIQTPVDDSDDAGTGFLAQERDFSWSGFDGRAAVVTFGNEFAFDKNIKFVIWDRANNAPVWRLTNQFLLNFEFFECGDSIFPGCHEAMSDRQRHGQTVEIMENNEVRKIVRWKGIPLNPQYNFSGEGLGGSEMPWYEEIWTFYPDGTGTRQLRESPKLDVPHRRQWGPEIIEPMPIGGSLVEAGDLCGSPALSVFTMTDSIKKYFPPPSRRENEKDSWNWPQVIYDCHFKDGMPDFYIVYNQSEEYPDTWTGIKLETQISWHNTGYNFSHWPVGREPYGQNTNGWGAESRSYASHRNEVTHTSLVSGGFYNRGLDYSDNYLTDDSGRRYRKHVMLTGVSKPYDYEFVRDNVQTWLEPGKITMKGNGSSFIKNDRNTRCLVFENNPDRNECSFILEAGERPVRNPAFQILNWAGNNKVNVTVNGSQPGFRADIADGNLLVWLNSCLTGRSEIIIRN